MKNATSSAPHICLNVLAKTCLMMAARGRSSATITSHETSVDVPPLKGAKLKVESTGFCVTEEFALTDNLNQLISGRCDQGPVQRTTTKINTMYGSQI